MLWHKRDDYCKKKNMLQRSLSQVQYTKFRLQMIPEQRSYPKSNVFLNVRL